MDMPTPSDSGWMNSTLDLIKPEIRAMKGYTAPPQGKVIAKLNQNENPYDIPAEFKQAILGRMASVAWTRYPMFSPSSLRERLADRHHVQPDEILLGNGSNQLLYLLASAVITPGDRILIPPPTFSLFDVVMKIMQGDLVLISKQADFTLDMDRMTGAAASAKLTLLVSPDNPTGAAIPLKDLETILRTTKGFVLWDEAYAEFGGESAIPLLGKYPNLLISRTFSKAFGLAGMRIGYFIGNPHIIRELQKANIPYNINLFSLCAANHLLDNRLWMEERVEEIKQERQKLFDQMIKIPHITPYASEANFILFGVDQKTQVFHSLKQQGVLIRDMGSTPPLDRCLRVTVGTPKENEIFTEGLSKAIRAQPFSLNTEP